MGKFRWMSRRRPIFFLFGLLTLAFSSFIASLQVFWIPVQLLNFKFVPVRHQLNVVLLTSIVWTALLSMWYPPVEELEEEAPITM